MQVLLESPAAFGVSMEDALDVLRDLHDSLAPAPAALPPSAPAAPAQAPASSPAEEAPAAAPVDYKTLVLSSVKDEALDVREVAQRTGLLSNTVAVLRELHAQGGLTTQSVQELLNRSSQSRRAARMMSRLKRKEIVRRDAGSGKWRLADDAPEAAPRTPEAAPPPAPPVAEPARDAQTAEKGPSEAEARHEYFRNLATHGYLNVAVVGPTMEGKQASPDETFVNFPKMEIGFFLLVMSRLGGQETQGVWRRRMMDAVKGPKDEGISDAQAAAALKRWEFMRWLTMDSRRRKYSIGPAAPVAGSHIVIENILSKRGRINIGKSYLLTTMGSRTRIQRDELVRLLNKDGLFSRHLRSHGATVETAVQRFIEEGWLVEEPNGVLALPDAPPDETRAAPQPTPRQAVRTLGKIGQAVGPSGALPRSWRLLFLEIMGDRWEISYEKLRQRVARFKGNHLDIARVDFIVQTFVVEGWLVPDARGKTFYRTLDAPDREEKVVEEQKVSSVGKAADLYDKLMDHAGRTDWLTRVKDELRTLFGSRTKLPAKALRAGIAEMLRMGGQESTSQAVQTVLENLQRVKLIVRGSRNMILAGPALRAAGKPAAKAEETPAEAAPPAAEPAQAPPAPEPDWRGFHDDILDMLHRGAELTRREVEVRAGRRGLRDAEAVAERLAAWEKSGEIKIEGDRVVPARERRAAQRAPRVESRTDGHAADPSLQVRLGVVERWLGSEGRPFPVLISPQARRQMNDSPAEVRAGYLDLLSRLADTGEPLPAPRSHAVKMTALLQIHALRRWEGDPIGLLYFIDQRTNPSTYQLESKTIVVLKGFLAEDLQDELKMITQLSDEYYRHEFYPTDSAQPAELDRPEAFDAFVDFLRSRYNGTISAKKGLQIARLKGLTPEAARRHLETLGPLIVLQNGSMVIQGKEEIFGAPEAAPEAPAAPAVPAVEERAEAVPAESPPTEVLPPLRATNLEGVWTLLQEALGRENRSVFTLDDAVALDPQATRRAEWVDLIIDAVDALEREGNIRDLGAATYQVVSREKPAEQPAEPARESKPARQRLPQPPVSARTHVVKPLAHKPGVKHALFASPGMERFLARERSKGARSFAPLEAALDQLAARGAKFADSQVNGAKPRDGIHEFSSPALTQQKVFFFLGEGDRIILTLDPDAPLDAEQGFESARDLRADYYEELSHGVMTRWRAEDGKPRRYAVFMHPLVETYINGLKDRSAEYETVQERIEELASLGKRLEKESGGAKAHNLKGKDLKDIYTLVCSRNNNMHRILFFYDAKRGAIVLTTAFAEKDVSDYARAGKLAVKARKKYEEWISARQDKYDAPRR